MPNSTEDVNQGRGTVMSIQPECPVFGLCGGCAYQDISYSEELAVKEKYLTGLLIRGLNLEENIFHPILPSSEPYHYRSRLDLTLKRTKTGGCLLGFQPQGVHQVVGVHACPIARWEISDFLPELKIRAEAVLPDKYRTANLVVRTGDDKRVLWGGIGKKSLVLKEKDYLWTDIRGKRIYYSLDTFFQANLTFLPRLMDQIESLVCLDSETLFFDLYAGVGLFGIYFADRVGHVVLVEESPNSVALSRFNAAHHRLKNVEIRFGKAESEILRIHTGRAWKRQVAIVDPPRKGLGQEAATLLARLKTLNALLYLSCYPESLLRDLRLFIGEGWKVIRVVPLDFFPRTQHLETLVLLQPY
ncbi:MAG: hypothetical protein NC930_09335 [Candidatus Omnitrophica bacterium]|nr:hypothetical protein [Candidatus Omnitrophota bacterium]